LAECDEGAVEVDGALEDGVDQGRRRGRGRIARGDGGFGGGAFAVVGG
jgi:hypothetical protein